MRFAQGKLREGSASPDTEILRCAQDDSQDPAHVLSREVFSPNVCAAPGPVNVPEKCVMYLAPARGATTCHAQQRPKCSGTPCGCQDNSQTLCAALFLLDNIMA